MSHKRKQIHHGTSMRDLMLTVEEAAEFLGLSQATIRSWMAHRRIGFTRLGRSVRIPRSAIEEIVERGKVPARK